MNHLKHIRGISIRASSNAALPFHYGQHTDVYLKNCELKSQLVWSNPLRVLKKNHGVDPRSRQLHQDSLRLLSKESKTICKQRGKNKSSVTLLKKKSSVHRKLEKRVCHYSTCRNVRFNDSGINKQLMAKSNAIVNGAKNINRHGSFIASVEKYPRSYAEMIAEYSESLRKESNAIRKSPFSTLSTSVPSAKKFECGEFLLGKQENDFSVPAQIYKRSNNENIIENYDFQYYNNPIKKDNAQNCGTGDSKIDDQSYAKLITDCSRSMMHNIVVASISNDLAPEKDVSVRKSSGSVIKSKKNSKDIKEGLSEVISSTMSINEKNRKTALKKDDRFGEIENVTSDKKITKIISEMEKSDVLQAVDASDNLTNGINGFTKLIGSKEQKKSDTVSKKLRNQSNKTDRMDFELQKHHYSHLTNRTSNPLRPTESTIKKSSTRASISGSNDVSREPQVKLRMVPSEKESVVSINVNQVSTGSLNPLDSKHLSVVVQSDKKEGPQLTGNQWNDATLQRSTNAALPRNDFGPMHISITEDSAPVKQIEFSINGKPISELKSITARTERLDVLSSADKIEIRIPFAKDNPNALDKIREVESKGINPSRQILNVKISANFQTEITKDNIETKTTKTMRQHDKDTSKSLISKTHGTTPNSESEIQRKAKKNVLPGNTTNTSLIKETNSKIEEKTNVTKILKENKDKKKESSDNRIPSKIIPWWSSSDSFNKIRKEEENYKPSMPLPNQNDDKEITKLSEELIDETLSLKPKKISKKKTQMKDDTIAASDSSNIISYSNSMKSSEESKLTFHSAYSFRLKPEQNKSANKPEIIKNNLKIEDNQKKITANKDINKVSASKQTKRITSSISTINLKDKQNVKENPSILPRKIKTPNSAQNLLVKKNQEELNNLLKQTSSIDNIFKTSKSKVNDILNSTKPIEKKENSILIDYSLKTKTSGQLLNNKMKEIQNLSLTKNLDSTNTVSEKINKTLLIKHTESNKEKIKAKMDILLKEKNFNNNMTNDVKMFDKNDVKNIKEIQKNNFTSSSSLNSFSMSKIPQAFKKQEQSNDSVSFQNKAQQNFKLLLKTDKNGYDSLSNTRTSSKTEQRSEKLEILEEAKKIKTKNSISIKNIIPEKNKESAKLKNLTSSKLVNPSENSSDTINKLQTVKQIQSSSFKDTHNIVNINKLSSSQTTSNLTLKIKDCPKSKNLTEKNLNKTFIIQKEIGGAITRIVTQNSDNKNVLSKNCEDNVNKLKLERRNLLQSADTLKKPNNSIGFKSAGTKIKSMVSNNNYTYGRKLLMESFYSNFNRKNDISNSKLTFERPENLSDINILKHSASTSTTCNKSWINMDRPEKSILYSAWLQRSENEKNKKLL